MEQKQSQGCWTAGAALGWMFGALSLINLLRSLSLELLTGKLASWADAYGWTIRALFGWMETPWFEISEREGHLIIIAFVLFASACRGFAIEGDDKPSVVEAVGTTSGLTLTFCFVAYIFAERVTLGFGVILVTLFGFVIAKSSEASKATVGIVGLAAILVALSHTLLR